MAFLFFDVDGTIWDYKNVIPESTKTALRLLRENGHRVFICSGRTKVFLRSPDLHALNFDGILSGCGTRVEYNGEELLYKTIDRDLPRVVRLFDGYEIPLILESRDYLFLDEDRTSRDESGKQLVETMRDVTQPIRGNEANLTASKFVALIHGTNYQGVADALEEDYKVMIHGGYVLEAVPKGYSKATGIAFLCDYLGADPEDTYGFGDGINDLEMLDFTGTGIAMGNGVDAAKELADYVTTDIHDDGIYNACRHFGLI